MSTYCVYDIMTTVYTLKLSPQSRYWKILSLQKFFHVPIHSILSKTWSQATSLIWIMVTYFYLSEDII